MYPSIRDVNLIHGGFENIAEGLSYLGLDAIEVNIDREMKVRAISPTKQRPEFVLNSAEAIEDYKNHLAEHRVRATSFLVANNFNADDVAAEIDWVVRVVNAAHALGMPVVRIDAAMRGERELPFEERTQRFVSCMKEVVAQTSDTDVELGIENHGRQGNDPQFLKAVLEAVGSERVGLTIDTGNFYWRGHPLERVYDILSELAPLAKHTHIKNISYPEQMRNTEREVGYEYGKYVCPIPDGDIDHARVVDILRAAGYERDLCIEDESLGKFPQRERRKVLKRDVEYLRSLC